MNHARQPCLRLSIAAVCVCCHSSCENDHAAPTPVRPAPPVASATANERPVAASSVTGEARPGWRPVGPGGGGHQEFPAISPHDPRLMFVACDMSGFYRSEDAGQHWQMDDQVRQISHPPVFHPTDPDVIYVSTRDVTDSDDGMRYGWSFHVSRDRGQTWSQVYGQEYDGFSLNEVSALIFDPDDPRQMWISFSLTGEIRVSHDVGASWEPVGEVTSDEGTARLVPGRKRNGMRTLFAQNGNQVFRSENDGATWTDVSPDGGAVVDLIGATTGHGDGQSTVLYVLGEPVGAGPETRGAIWRSRDDGATWKDLSAQFVAGADPDGTIVRMRRIEVCLADPDTAYVSAEARGARGAYHYGMFKSVDAGATWQFLFPHHTTYNEFRLKRHDAEFEDFKPGWVPREFYWGGGGTAMNIAVCPSDPDELLWTDMARTIGSRDGGDAWEGLYCNQGAREHYTTRGLDVTGGYRVVFDPHHEDRMWIASNDIGNWRSDDRGASWRYAMRGAKHRLCMYELIADPDIPDRLYGATSNLHDLPRWRFIARDAAEATGGFVVSGDGGLTWTTQGEGLPEAACTALALDPRSDPENRTLYVIAWGHGVYKSVDSGRSWVRQVAGMESYLELNEHLFALGLGPDGTLYAAITKRVRLAPGQPAESRGGALFVSEDGAESWRRVGPQTPELPSGARNEFSYLWDVVVSPHDPDEVVAACCVDPHSRAGAVGGLYRSRDRGVTWERIFNGPRCCRIDFHPTDPSVLFCGAGDGLHWSRDRGATWQAADGIPFKREVTRTTVDPDNPDRIWVTTWGGGVWTGMFRE